MENKVVLQRIIKTSPEKLFRAFSDPVAYASWVPPYGFLCTVQKMDFKVGGTYAMTFTNFTTESSHSFGGEFVEIQPNEFLKITDILIIHNYLEQWLLQCGSEKLFVVLKLKWSKVVFLQLFLLKCVI